MNFGNELEALSLVILAHGPINSWIEALLLKLNAPYLW